MSPHHASALASVPYAMKPVWIAAVLAEMRRSLASDLRHGRIQQAAWTAAEMDALKAELAETDAP